MALPARSGRFKHYRLHPHPLATDTVAAILQGLAAEPGLNLLFQSECLPQVYEQIPELHEFFTATRHPACNVFVLQHRLFWDPAPSRWHNASLIGSHWPQVRAPHVVGILNLHARLPLVLSLDDDQRPVAVVHVRPQSIVTVCGQLRTQSISDTSIQDAPHGLILEQHRLSRHHRHNLPEWYRL